MKKNIIFAVIILFFLPQIVCLAQGTAPHQIGGFTLGKNISEYQDKLKMETSYFIRHQEYLKEVEIKGMEGFKSGIIAYGVCDSPGRIVRIKLKYANSTKKFYDELLKHFKKRFGEPSEWRGDSFHIVIAWKWSFTDSKNNKVSLTLQHNTKDQEEKMGNSVKISMTNFIDQEILCHKKKQPEERKGSEIKKREANKLSPADWNRFIPR